MKIFRQVLVLLLVILCALMVMSHPKTYKKPRNNRKPVKHSRIAPSGGIIGFVKERYWKWDDEKIKTYAKISAQTINQKKNPYTFSKQQEMNESSVTLWLTLQLQRKRQEFPVSSDENQIKSHFKHSSVWESNKIRRPVNTMQKRDIFLILLLIVLLINYSEQQGSASNSIAAYITLYKERKRLRLEKEKRRAERREKEKQRTKPTSPSNVEWTPRAVEYEADAEDFQTIGDHCAKFPFYYSACAGQHYNHYYWLK